jgi:hypothetical protein
MLVFRRAENREYAFADSDFKVEKQSINWDEEGNPISKQRKPATEADDSQRS